MTTTIVTAILTCLGTYLMIPLIQKGIEIVFARFKTKTEESIKSDFSRKNIAYQVLTSNSVTVRNSKIEEYYKLIQDFEKTFIKPMTLFTAFDKAKKIRASIPENPYVEFSKIEEFNTYEIALSKLTDAVQLLSLYISEHTLSAVNSYITASEILKMKCSAVSLHVLHRKDNGDTGWEIDYRDFSQGDIYKQILESEESPVHSEPNEYGISYIINHPFFIAHQDLTSKYNLVIKAFKKELITPVLIE